MSAFDFAFAGLNGGSHNLFRGKHIEFGADSQRVADAARLPHFMKMGLGHITPMNLRLGSCKNGIHATQIVFNLIRSIERIDGLIDFADVVVVLFRYFGAFDYLVETLVLRFVHCVEEGIEDLATCGVFGEVEGKHHIRSLLLCGR